MRLAQLVTLPTIITKPGLYETRYGEIVTVDSIDKGWANGHYPNNVQETWDESGRLLPFSLSQNDIVRISN